MKLFFQGNLAEMHYIINGEDKGTFTRKLPYKEAPLYAVVDVYGTTKQVRIIQLYGPYMGKYKNVMLKTKKVRFFCVKCKRCIKF